jgi:tRNA modification GTPase
VASSNRLRAASTVVRSRFLGEGFNGANGTGGTVGTRAIMLDRMDRTIAAISSAAGRSPLGILRLSGPEAIPIAERMTARLSPDGETMEAARPMKLSHRPAWRRWQAELGVDETLTAPAVIYLFRSPRSYTRQDLVEFHLPGSPVLLEMARRRAIALGAEPALPGEFTARAFLNGGMDLSRAEATASLIRARTDGQLRAARRWMEGALAEKLAAARDAIAETLALVEADIDFAEEPIEFITPAELRKRLGDVRATLQGLSDGAVSAERLEALPRILLLGPPNAGKSSLMNRLSGTNRAICAAIAGTTRDLLSAPIAVGRGEAILLDAAGVDDDADDLLARARTRTLATSEQVDLVCLVLDASEIGNDRMLDLLRRTDGTRRVLALNKSDLLSLREMENLLERWRTRGVGPVVAVSALRGTGVEALRGAFADVLGEQSGLVAADSPVLTERQRTALAAAIEAVERSVELAADLAETVDRADVLAFELREALHALGEVTGEVTTEDLLTQVFSRFCIGK